MKASMTQVTEFCIVADDGLAIRIGELLCDALHGDLSRQNPLFAMDRGTYWRVEGSLNRDGTMDGPAEFFLSIDKTDGRVSDIGEVARIAPHPSVIPIINEHYATEQSQQRLERTTLGPHLERYSGSEIEPKGASECMLLLTKLGRGGVVGSEDLAIRLGEILCQVHYGDLARQTPLMASDKDTYWRVEGNWNRDGKMSEAGPFFVSIEKYDGRVTEVGE
jgi:hypothetical protein